MAKAFSYIRFSTPEQARGDSLRRQLQDTQAWAKANGHVLDDSLRDLGKSAYKGKHATFGALRRFLDLVESGEVERGSYLVMESLDRLSREAVLDALPRLLDLIAAGVTVVTLQDRQEYSDSRLRADPSPLIMSLLIMMRAHEESKTKGMRVGKAWTQKRVLAADTGQAMTAICPGWIRLVGDPKTGHYELIPERAAIVKRMFEASLAGQGRRAIVNALNAKGVPTWGEGEKRGERWHDSYVQKILAGGAAIGRFEPEVLGLVPWQGVEACPYRLCVRTNGQRHGSGANDLDPVRMFALEALIGEADLHRFALGGAELPSRKKALHHNTCAHPNLGVGAEPGILPVQQFTRGLGVHGLREKGYVQADGRCGEDAVHRKSRT